MMQHSRALPFAFVALTTAGFAISGGAPLRSHFTPSPSSATPRADTPARVPHVVFVTGDDEYRSEITMPMIASLLQRAGYRTSLASAKPRPQTKDNIEGLEALATADLMVLFTRFRALPETQLRAILDYVDAGKPVIGLRTATHAFNYPKESTHFGLNDGFSLDLFGQKWITHHGHRSSTDVTLHDANRGHPILRGISAFHARSWLYHVAPLQGGDDNVILLDGRSMDSEKTPAMLREFSPTQPVAWTRQHKGARVFFTTLGHPIDFEQPSMRRLLVNAVHWTLGREVPALGSEVDLPGGFYAPDTFDLSKVK